MITPQEKKTYLLRDTSSVSPDSPSPSDVTPKKVTFLSAEKERSFDDDELSVSSNESFCEIVTTSEAESLVSSDEEDIEMLDIAFERAYTCSRRHLRPRVLILLKEVLFCCWTRRSLLLKVSFIHKHMHTLSYAHIHVQRFAGTCRLWNRKRQCQ